MNKCSCARTGLNLCVQKRDEMAHLLNLHEDDRMTMILAFFFDAPTTRICRPEAPNPPAKTDIVLSGLIQIS